MKKKTIFVLGALAMMAATSLSSCNTTTKDQINNTGIENPIDTSSIPEDANENAVEFYLLALSSGFNGTYKEWLASISAKTIELSETEGTISWRYKGDESWTPLYNTSSLVGDSGLSAYEIYKKYHEDYDKDETEWYIDLVNGALKVTKTNTSTEVTKNLEYTLSEDGKSYYVSGIGEDLVNTEIVVPSTYNGKAVTKVSPYAFYYRNDITSITLPSTVTEIGENAFMGCSSLVTIKSSATTFGEDAFYGCNSLTNVYYDMSISNIFYNTYANEKANPMYYAKKAYARNMANEFFNYNSAIVLDIPSTVVKINKYALLNFDELINIVIPSSVLEIEEGALKGCSKLKAITVPFTGEHNEAENENALFGYIFGDEAFDGSIPQTARYNEDGDTQTYYVPSSLVSITINTPEIKYGAFMGMANVSQFMVTTEIINEYAFASCSKLESTNMNGVKQIKSNAFLGCAIKNLILPETLECIGTGALAGLNEIKSLSLPRTIKAIEKGAFKGTTNLEEITITSFNGDYNKYFSGDAINTLGFIFGDEYYEGSTKITQNYSSSASYDFYIPSKLKTVNFDIKNETAIPYGYLSNITTITNVNILDGSSITTIEDYAYKNTSITELDLTGYTASYKVLSYLDKLETLNLGDIALTDDLKANILNVKKLNCGSNTEITNGYFMSFSKLEYIDLGSVTKIGPSAFLDSPVKTIIGKNVTSLENDAFKNTTNLTSVDLPLTETIGDSAFEGSCITSLNSNNIKTIGKSAFKLSKLSTIDLSKCTSIGVYAFSNSELTGDIVLNNCTIGLDAFYKTKINTLEIKGLATIPQYLAYQCTNLTKVVIDAKTVEKYAFEGCTSLTECDLSTVTSLGSYCFKDTKLKEIILNDSITYNKLATNNPFYNVTSAEKVYTGGCDEIWLVSCLGANKETLKELILGENATTFCDNIDQFPNLQYNYINGLKYLGSKNSDYFACCGIDLRNDDYLSFNGIFTVEDTCKIIARKAFYTSSKIKKLTLKPKTQYIGYGSFINTSIETVVLKNTATQIQANAFDSCSKLTTINLEYCTYIAGYAFDSCSKLTDVDLSNVTYFGPNAFQKCTGLTSVDISSATSIGTYAFYSCTSLESAVLGTTLTIIPQNLFNYCPKLTTCNIPASVTAIGASAFENCTSYAVDLSLTNVTDIASYAFKGSAVKSLTGAKIEKIYDSAFQDCTSLTTVKAVNAKEYGDSCFEGCTNLTQLNYTNSTITSDTNLMNATSIGEKAFYNCNIKRIKLGEDITTVGANAFMENSAISEIDIGYYEVSNNKFSILDFVNTTSQKKIVYLRLNDSVHYFNAREITNTSFNYNVSGNLRYISGYIMSGSGQPYTAYMCVGTVPSNSGYGNLSVNTVCRVIASYAFYRGEAWSTSSTHKITIPSSVQYINTNAIYGDAEITAIEITKTSTVEKEFQMNWLNSCSNITSSSITLSGTTTNTKFYRYTTNINSYYTSSATAENLMTYRTQYNILWK